MARSRAGASAPIPNWMTQVITTKTADTEPSILLTFEDAKYYFNVGENSTRALIETRKGHKKVKAVFLTQTNTRTTSGLVGFLMKAADSAAREIDIIGPRGLLHLFASMRSYMYRNTMAMNITEVSDVMEKPEPVYKDGIVTVYAIATTTASPGSLLSKRKRSPSLDEPSKRQQISLQETITPRSHTASNTRSYRIPYSQLASAITETGDELKRKIIEHMFTWSPPARSKPGDLALEQEPAAGSIRGYNSIRQQLESPEDIDRSRALAYVVVGPTPRGKFDAKAADKLGLRGPDRGRITKGETVTFDVDDGQGGKISRTVRPEDVLGESMPPGVVIIVDVPTPGHIDSLVLEFSQPFYAKLRSKSLEATKAHNVHAVYHLLGKGVLDDARYQTFLRDFPDHTHHFIASPEYSPDRVTMASVAYSQLRFSQIDAEIFPPLKFNLNASKTLSEISNLPPNTHILQAHTNMPVHPPKPVEADQWLATRDEFHPAVVLGDAWTLPEETKARFNAAKESVQSVLAEQQARPARPGDDLVVVPLGTTSSVCSRYRNFSGYLLQIPEGRGWVMLDPGEGTYGQMCRSFGTDERAPESAASILRDVKAIFVSHGHADHHAGLAKVLSMRRQLDPPPTEPLFLIASYTVHLYIREQQDLEDFGLVDSFAEHTSNLERGGFSGNVIPILNEAIHQSAPMPKYFAQNGLEFPWSNPASSRVSTQVLCAELQLKSAVTIDVDHSSFPSAIILESREGWKFVYSGDTRPTDKLVQAGKGATLLIHEATMDDELAELANAKGHSTIGQALDIGKRMGAENILLTHFSTRYPSMARTVFDQAPNSPTVAMAFDHARLRVRDLWKVSRYMGAIEKTIEDTQDEGDAEEEKALFAATQYQ